MAGPWEQYSSTATPATPSVGPWTQYGNTAAAPTAAPKPRSWSDVPGEAISNIPSSAGNFASGIYQAVRHPIDTAGNMLDMAAGGLRNALPSSISDAIDRIDPNPQAAQRATGTANAVGQFYKDRYGSLEGLKNTLATDPVGVAADISTIAAGGAGAARLGGQVPGASRMADILQRASSATNPVNAVAPVVRGVVNAGATAGRNVLGLSTGVGAENVAQAFRSGREGKPSFIDNLSGKTEMTDVLDLARQNVQNMGAQKSASYRSGMLDITNDKSVLDFKNIDQALQNANNVVSYKGQVKNSKGAQLAEAIGDEVRQWKALDPAEFHTPEGLDALKQKIGGLVDSIPFEEKTARMVGNNIYNSVKSEISAQAPTYAKTMKDYADATDQIREIERSLSLGSKASADTAMRKLQSLSRNNVNTNYGNRLELARALEAGGGNEVLPAIAGQAMNSWMPRGLVGQGGGMATVGAAVTANPMLAALLPFQSPRAVGSTLYGAGRATGAIDRGLGAVGNRLSGFKPTPAQTQNALLGLYQAGNLPQENQR